MCAASAENYGGKRSEPSEKEVLVSGQAWFTVEAGGRQRKRAFSFVMYVVVWCVLWVVVM